MVCDIPQIAACGFDLVWRNPVVMNVFDCFGVNNLSAFYSMSNFLIWF